MQALALVFIFLPKLLNDIKENFILKVSPTKALYFISNYHIYISPMPHTHKIFVADDDPDILEILSLMLGAHGYGVIATTDPNIIFDYEEAELPDLILLDIWLNGIDGRDVCKRLKDSPQTRQVPIIFVSANSNIAEITKECKAEGYIAKPFEMSQLIKTIREILPEK
ncbi:MAG: response regulator [Chitinophagaceae bacterium]|nr:MAG: response regulator [Chitinophagaceae bacterium]